MTRKLIAMLLCVMMIASIITVPVFADEVSYADYVPGEKPANMLKSVKQLCDEKNNGSINYSLWWGSVGTIKDSNGKVTRSQTNGYKGTSLLAKGTPGGEMTGTSGDWYHMNAGLYIGQSLIIGNTPGGLEGDIDDGKNYVYAMQVRNLDPTYTPNIRFLLYDLDGPAGLNAKEWGAAGMPVTSTEWMDFKGSIAAPERNKADTANDVDRLSLGYNSSTVAGSKVDINFTDESEGMYRMYFAEEAVYDITNELTSASNIITSKSSATFKAEILNQVGLPGNLNQGTFEWKVMDTARTTEYPGFTVAANGATATVTVDETVPAGTYTVVAYNSTYNMAKGYNITVDTPSEYLDYEPGAKPANMFKSASEVGGASSWWANMGTTGDSAGRVARSQTNGYKGTSITAKGTPGGAMEGTAGAWYQINAGVYAGSGIFNGNNPSGIAGDIDDGKNYVYEMQVRNLDTTYTPYVRFLLYDLDGPAGLNAKEWGSAGMPVTSTDWMDFKGTIQAPERNKADTANDVDRISIGFNATAVAGSSIDMNFTDDSEGKYPLYFAEEALYDITNELEEGSSDTIDCKGKSAVLKAQLVNQVGLPGYLEQGTFTWKALDVATRKTEITGITITTSDDTAIATVTVDETVEPGEYVIVAKNGDMAKGYIITVAEPNYYLDNVPVMPENMLINPTDGTAFLGQVAQTCGGSGAAAMVSRGNGVNGKIAITANGTAGEAMSGTGPAYYFTRGLYFGSKVIKSNNPSGFGGDIADNMSYAFKIQVRNLNEEIVPNVHVLLYDLDGPSANYTAEHGSAGLAVTSTDWMDLKGTIKNPDRTKVDTANDVDRLSIGFPTGTLAGAKVEFNFTDESEGMYRVYFAPEKAYDVENALTAGSATLTDGQQAEFTAQVVNQVGVVGNMKQNIEWRVMNKARTADVDGFVITEGANGAATIKVDGAAPGTYDVVAYSADYKMAKGVEITVTDAQPEVTMITVDSSEADKFTVAAVEAVNVAVEKILVAVASYADVAGGKKVADADKEEVTVVDGRATLVAPITIDAAAGSEVRVFVWDAATLAPIKLAQDVVASFTK